MKFTLARETLLPALNMVCGAVERRSNLPILSNVLVSVEEGKLSLTGTDLEVELMTELPLEGAEPGDITVPAKKFLDIVKAVGDKQQISFQLGDGRVNLRAGNSRFTLTTQPASEFPSVEEGPGAVQFEISQNELRSLFERTQFAIAQGDVRYYMNGLFFELKVGRLRTVATDGHRLALAEAKQAIDSQGDFGVIIPRKGVIELSRLLEPSDTDVKVTVGTNHIRLQTSQWQFVSKLVDGKFPDYEKVIPRGGDKFMSVNREMLKESLLRAAILCNEKFRGVRLSLSQGSLTLNANNPEQEEAVINLDVDYSGPDLEIGFNVNYLLDMVNAVKWENIRFQFIDSSSSAVAEEQGGSGTLFLVMPMRL
ncbi:DNA polymerase III subunit beta [Permianibacter aggregans]|uniref:Beta sliding clamp n=1 Tax=Permianibacter aggregans TaxID=1510150 RepID=A0A4R6UJM8_9GAMM|nr:DNA polymerase III subunit beta [Permianibacter aggregans]QGX39866.1 DNA polymerase III subunit beta [Permianibacter aggregans]TDQ43414.1 DNA polymerase III beta subunit [Permianibacter aggregans]